MTEPQFDIAPFLNQDEGQHFERKSLYEGPPESKRGRNRRAVRDDVAENVAAFANAEGGVLVLGIEDDRSVAGHALPARALESLLATPRTRLLPAQPEGFVVTVGGDQLIVFDVSAADVPVQVMGDGFPVRIGDKTVQASESQIRALKLQGLAESWESRASSCAVADLDHDLLARARKGAGLAAWGDEEYLLKRKLADRRGANIVLRRAAELLFARSGPDHPNAGVRVFRVIGTERRTGAEHNVEERPRIEGNLAAVLEEAWTVVAGLLRRPSRLVGTQFQQVPEYPEFSWKEALLNAIAHRDYAVEGAGSEVWLFDDRMEVLSPGGLVGGLTVEEVLKLERIHRSRNPRLIRVLVDLGLARDQGEGIPRMFAEMEDAFLPRPDIEVGARGVRVTLRNTPTLTSADRAFVAGLGSTELAQVEFRALLHAHRHARVDNADMRLLAGLDTLEASLLLRRLRDRGLLELHPHGANSYYTLPQVLVPEDRADTPVRELLDLAIDRGGAATDRGELAADRGELSADRVEPEADGGAGGSDRVESGEDRRELPAELLAEIAALGERPRKERLREVIVRISNACGWVTATEFSRWLGFRHGKLTERHLSPMVEAGRLERRYPDSPNHPEQAYRAVERQAELRFGEEIGK